MGETQDGGLRTHAGVGRRVLWDKASHPRREERFVGVFSVSKMEILTWLFLHHFVGVCKVYIVSLFDGHYSLTWYCFYHFIYKLLYLYNL